MPDSYDAAMNYINATKVDEDEFLRYRITERFNQILRDVYSANSEKAEQYIPSAITDTNEMTGFMLELLDQVKSGKVEIETPMDAVALMMNKMGVSKQEIADVFGELPDDGNSISENMVHGIMDRFGIRDDELSEIRTRYGIAKKT